MSTIVVPSASMLGVIANPETLPVLGSEAKIPEGAFAQVLAAIEGEVAEAPVPTLPEASALPSAIAAPPLPPTPPEPPIAIADDIVTTLAPFEAIEPSTMTIPPSAAATPTDDATIEPAPSVPATTIAALPKPTDMQPITPPAETPPRHELVRATAPVEVAPLDDDAEWTPIAQTVLAEPEPRAARPTEARDLPREPFAACDELPMPDAIVVAAPSLPPPPRPVERAPIEDAVVAAPQNDEDDGELDAPPSITTDVIVPTLVATSSPEPMALVRNAPEPEIEAHEPEAAAPKIDLAAPPNTEPARARIDAPPHPETRTAAPEAAPRTAPPAFAPRAPHEPAPAPHLTTTAAPETTDALAVPEALPSIAPRTLESASEPTRIATKEPTCAMMPTLDAMPTLDTAAREAPSLDAPTATPPSTIDPPARAPVDAPPKPPIVLARAEDLALAIEELRPIPKGGATVDVEAPGLGAIRLHVAVEGDTVKIRIHAGSDALAWFAREHDGLCSAARQAVPESQSVDLQLQTGSDSRGNQSQPHTRTYASEDAPQPQRMRAPTPKSESTPTSTSPRSLVDVLA